MALMLMQALNAQAGTETNYSLMPKADSSLVNFGLAYVDIGYSVKFNDSPTFKVKGNSTVLVANYYYGLNADNAIGAEMNYLQSEYSTEGSSSKSKSKGPSELFLNYKGKYSLGAPILIYTFGAKISLENATYSSQSGESNASSGQNQILASVGIETPVNSFILGGTIGYENHLDGKEENTNSSGQVSTYTKKRGDSLRKKIYAEYNNDFHPSLAILHDNNYSSTSIGDGYVSNSTPHTMYGLAIMSRYEFNPQASIIGGITYLQAQMESERYKIESSSFTSLAVSGQFSF